MSAVQAGAGELPLDAPLGRPEGTVEAPRRLRYSPSLDGLRALAVAAVVAYHLDLPWASAGFFGVDVFFVISGYLITALLVAERRETGRIAYGAFCLRRMRRLLPALGVMLAVVAATSPLWATAEELAKIRADGLGALLYVANWQQMFGDVSYFTGFSTPSPFKHTWSLAVEEQWYVVWPLVLAATWRLFGGRRGHIVAAILVGTAVSAAAMVALAAGQGDTTRAYYGTDARAQTLLVGALVAVLFERWVPGRRARAVVHLAGVGGLVALGAATFLQTGTSPANYEGGFTVVALCAAAVVAATRYEVGALCRVLAWRPLVATGRVSYGIYLWHWPVFVVLVPGRIGVDGAALTALRLVVTAVFTVASWYLVERRDALAPALAARWVRGAAARLAPVPAAPAAALGSVGVLAVLVALVPTAAALGAGPPTIPPPPPVEPWVPPADDRPSGVAPSEPAGVAVDPAAASATVPTASSQPSDPRQLRVLLVGDSVSFKLAEHVRPLDTGDTLEVRSASLLGCGVAQGRLRFRSEWLPANPRCRDWPSRWREAVAQQPPDISVVMIGAWEVYDRMVDGRFVEVGTRRYADLLHRELSAGVEILEAGGPVVLTNVPCMHEPPFPGRHGDVRNDPARIGAVNEVIERVAAERPSVTVVDLDSFLCDDGVPRDRAMGFALRSDGVHPTLAGGRLVWQWLTPQLHEIASRR